jgi:hypothetical protein
MDTQRDRIARVADGQTPSQRKTDRKKEEMSTALWKIRKR